MSKTLEELGYEKEENDYIVVFINSINSGEQIVFDKLRKEVVCEEFINGAKYIAKNITMEELKAIYKYCEDNKWI